MSRADTLAAKSVHLSHLRRVKEVEATVSKAKDHAEQLTTLKLEHQKTYVKLRNEILGEMTHTAKHLKKYKQARKMAIKYMQRCQHKVTTVCQPGLEGTPNCREVRLNTHD